MNAEDIRRMAPEERETELGGLRRELLNLRCRIALGEDVNSNEVRRVRRDIARFLTVARQTGDEGELETAGEQNG